MSCIKTQILILGTTLALVFHVFHVNLIWHLPVAANLIQVFSHFINAEVGSHFRVLYSWISTWHSVLKKNITKNASFKASPAVNLISKHMMIDPKALLLQNILFISMHSVQWASSFLGLCAHGGSPVLILQRP